jgi:hypothetical protein
MSNQPPERAVELNATQEQLNSNFFEATMAFAPSQREEAAKGYDVTFENVTELDLQYKAIKKVQGPTVGDTDREREHEICHSASDREGLVAVKFNFKSEQAETLLNATPSERIAFYALPVVMYKSGLEDILTSTLFLDVYGLIELTESLSNYTSFWVPLNLADDDKDKIANNSLYPSDADEEVELVDDIEFEPTFSEVHMKRNESKDYKPRTYERIRNEYIYQWSDIEDGIAGDTSDRTIGDGGDRANESDADIGIPVRVDGESDTTKAYDKFYDFRSSLRESKVRQRFEDEINDVRQRFEEKITGLQQEVTGDMVRQRSLEDFANDMLEESNKVFDAIRDERTNQGNTERESQTSENKKEQIEQIETALRSDESPLFRLPNENDKVVEIDCAGLDPTQANGRDYIQNYFMFGEELTEDDQLRLSRITI